MKRLFATVLTGASFAVALCFFIPQSALARPLQGWVATTLEGGSANLRALPSTSANVLATLRNGSSFSIVNERIDVGYRWYQVRPTAVNLTANVWIRSDLVSFAAPFAAQPRLSCNEAIAQTETSLKAIANTRIISRSQRRHGYPDGPSNRPNSYGFTLAGSGGNNILASPVLMNRMAVELIENCPDTGLVTFSLGETDSQYVNYGFMPERLVRPFQCKVVATEDGSANESASGSAKWGEQICL
jgi:hypothetical protein